MNIPGFHRARKAVLLAAAFLAMLGASVVAAPGAGAVAPGFATVAPYSVPRPPSHNIRFVPPAICDTKPTGAACENTAVADLDLARSKLGLPPYVLPAHFVNLRPIEQSFILTNLDRRLYQEPVFHGTNATLSHWAAKAMAHAPRVDPSPRGRSIASVPWYAYGGNSAVNFPNILFAYAAWMYDDGPGSTNEDCAAAAASGCWGHRHNILGNYRVCYGGNVEGGQCVGGKWKYLADLSYGAAVGRNAAGKRAYTQLLVGGPSLLTSYRYTWNSREAKRT